MNEDLQQQINSLRQELANVSDLYFRTHFVDKDVFSNPVYFDGNVFFKKSWLTITYASTITMNTSNSFLQKTTTVNATGNATINATVPGQSGQVLKILITNDATSGKVITFGTNFKSSGTLTGTTSKSALISFISDGISWYEQFRTLAIT